MSDDKLRSMSRLLQFTDSTFPVGTFSFSNGLETAAELHMVKDAASLEAFVDAQVRQAAYTDGIAAIHAYRAAVSNNYDEIIEADNQLILCKMNDEARLMLRRMGKKLAELGVRLFDHKLISRLLDDISAGKTDGCYPVVQGVVFAVAGLDEEQLFASHRYGVANMVLGAALRCVRVSHYDTQEILFRLDARAREEYEAIRDLGLEDMNAFFPMLDIVASLHEKGKMRMFMN